MSMIDEMEQAKQWKYPHVVQAALEYERGSESSNWRLGDALLEDIGAARGASRAAGVRSGLHEEVEKAYREARNAGAKELAIATLAKTYTTAVAWPPEDRVASASFAAHQDLAARTWDGKRKNRLERLVAESTDGYVTHKDVRLWKSSQEPAKPPVPFLDQLEQAVVIALKRKGSPWDRVAEDDRKAVATMLRRLATQIALGEFGKEVVHDES